MIDCIHRESSTITRLSRVIRTDPEACSWVPDRILIKECFDVLPNRAAQEVLTEQLRIIFSIIEAIVVFYRQMGYGIIFNGMQNRANCHYYCL